MGMESGAVSAAAASALGRRLGGLEKRMVKETEKKESWGEGETASSAHYAWLCFRTSTTATW